jgi:hypothetical protein
MSQPRYSRQLAGRVEIEFHRHPNRFRRLTWWTALICVIAAGAWLVQAGTRGEHRIYEAGDVSTPHAMFENDCKQCHIDNWAPAKRLVTFSDDVHSVSNQKCVVCHIGPIHHHNQTPVHGDMAADLSCAKCHREHKGDEQLARVADRHCTDCHSDLDTTDSVHTFAMNVTSFEETEGHPDFRIEQLLKEKDDKNITIAKNGEDRPVHHAFNVVGFIQRAGEEPAWQDKAHIKFNHQAHLKAMFDAEGGRIKGGRQDDIKRQGGDRDGELIGYPTQCTDCHQFDEDRRYMKPINYEAHCKSCHPLTFDVDKFIESTDPKTQKTLKLAVTVPHEAPGVVRGYLSKVYSLDTLDDEPADAEAASDPLAELRRGFPGRDFEANFTAEAARKILNQISEEEKSLYPLEFIKNEIARRKGQEVLFKENGACALCHDITKHETKDTEHPEPWTIVPPEIPQRWLKHSRFRHDSHRMLSCVECHFDMKSGVDPDSGEPVRSIYQSASTGDVLMPHRQLCITCHRTGPGEQPTKSDSRLLGARVDCVECHGYHDYSKEDFDGNLKLDLTTRGD